ncbi:MAG: AAA family ATPase, partial [Treponema sp.]|nr:AAA family ATPase [Treponema sp.]
SLTEDIVTELDAKLKNAGYSSSANKKAKENVSTVLEKIKIYAAGRTNIFNDFASLPSHSEKDAAQFSKDAVAAFTEIGAMLTELSELIDAYTKTTPQFIDDFLSPEGIITKKRNIDQLIEENLASIQNLSKLNEELLSVNETLSDKIDDYKNTLSKLRITQAQMTQQITSCEQQISTHRKMLASEETALKEQKDDLFNEMKHKDEMDEQIADTEELIAELEEQGVALTKELNRLDEQIAECNSKASGKENALKKKQEEKNKYQARLENLSVTIVQNDTEIRNVKQNFQDNYSRDLMEFEERMYTITATPSELREKLTATRQKIADLGQVNLMAIEMFAEEKERYERQQASYDDTKKSLENLIRVSEEIRTKSSELFLSTYNKIRRNFHNMFRRLFNGGGRAELRLVDPSNVLTTGIEIFAQPPGKKLVNISLLSGGEKTMTAMALLFATYQVRSSPFCLLDEIDAALDDKNVSSLVNALRAFANVSQYIVITHNRKTVMGASSMIGVTMQESGITSVVQLKLDEDTINGKATFDDSDTFEEEDIPEEEGIVIPPRPPRREHNPDGTLKISEKDSPQVEGQTAENIEETEQSNGNN